MKKTLPLLLLLYSIAFVECNAQQSTPLDRKQIVKASELNFGSSDKRGIELEIGRTVFVEQNMKVLTAYKNGMQLYKSEEIAKCGESIVGKAEIRLIKNEDDKIKVVFGKHSFARVIVASGKVECLGAD